MFRNKSYRPLLKSSKRKISVPFPVAKYTLVSLVAELQRRAQTEPQGKLIGWLYDLSKELDLRIRYDEYSTILHSEKIIPVILLEETSLKVKAIQLEETPLEETLLKAIPLEETPLEETLLKAILLEETPLEETLLEAKATLLEAKTTLPEAKTILPEAKTTLPEAKTILPEANLPEANLPEANLLEANLPEANLPEAKTTLLEAKTTLPEANLPEAKANLPEAAEQEFVILQSKKKKKTTLPKTFEKKNINKFSKRRGKQIPYSIVEGRMILHFNDPALLEHDPPLSGNFSHLAANDKFVGRIIISCGRRVNCNAPPLCVESNGAVIDARTWRLLAIPPRAFTTQLENKEIDRILSIPDVDGQVRTGGYEIIKINDGTVVTLYRWDHPIKGPIWCLASSNGYDVSHLKWMGEKTYAELVYEQLSAYPKFTEATGLELLHDHLCENDIRLSFTQLDPHYCYTIGFRHPNFHPMMIDPPGIWTIQTTDLASGIPQLTIGLPFIPHQVIYSREDINRLAAACGRSIGPRLTVADFDYISSTALEEAKAAIARGKVSDLNYGFILRSKWVSAADVLRESPLLSRVRQLIYQRPSSRQIHEELTATTRLEYNALKAFLTVTTRDEFLSLFPEFKPRFKKYEAFLSEIIRQVLLLARNQNIIPGERSASQIVARAMLTHIRNYTKDFNVFHKDAWHIVDDFITRPAYASLYLRAMTLE